jgi:hypothetical protein
MGEIVNLRRARKVREKRARDAEAEANRAAFGRTKAERDLAEATARLENKKLDARRLEKPGSAPK